jgi:putative hydrolase of the HAD superfamily
MTIRAVVLDVGGVLEVVDDSVFPEPFRQRHCIDAAALEEALTFPRDPTVGEMTEAEVERHLREALGLDDDRLAELVADMWRWYVGTLDERLFDWFSRVRGRGLKAGILSNSGPGARERERHYGFEAIVDVLVYSHEVGLKKPDPAIYELTAQRLGVAGDEIAFLDDWVPAIEAAEARGWHGVLHVDTERSIAELERLIAG